MRVNVSSHEIDCDVKGEENINHSLEPVESSALIVEVLDAYKGYLHWQRYGVVNGEENDEYVPVKLVAVRDRNDVPPLPRGLKKLLLLLVKSQFKLELFRLVDQFILLFRIFVTP